jgi:hypothetical protein
MGIVRIEPNESSGGGLTIANLELEFSYSNSSPDYFKELTYTEGILTNISIYSDENKTTKLFDKELTYTEGILSGIVITRMSDETILTKSLEYNIDGSLKSISTIQS